MLSTAMLSPSSTVSLSQDVIMIQIKHKFSGDVLFEAEVGSLKACLELAVNKNADLRGANLREADLYGANLYGADLYGADLYKEWLDMNKKTAVKLGIKAEDFEDYRAILQL